MRILPTPIRFNETTLFRMRMKTKKKYNSAVFGAAFGGAVALAALVGSSALSPSVAFTRIASTTAAVVADEVPTAVHVKTPDSVRAVYMSQCAAGTPSFRGNLIELIDTTELNAIIIDIRDYTGKIAFPSDDPVLGPMVSDECGAKDMQAFVERLHGKGIYVIGRVTVFQNPYWTSVHPEHAVQSTKGGVWKDHKGLSFVDVSARPYWETVVTLAKESYAIGFDEINFDYIRFPSDGPMAEADATWSRGMSKPEALEQFFKYLHNELAGSGMVTSADLFGMTTTNTDDLNIGQVLERTLPYFDYVAPMVYPSHYPKGFHGYSNVNENSYGIVQFSMSEAVRRTVATTSTVAGLTHTRIGTSTPALYAKPAYPASKMRPWLQDFDYPVDYTPAMVRAQIQANADAGLTSYMFWDPANKYSSLRQILEQE